jgi:hypothetical protein
MQQERKLIPATQMHGYVFGLLGVFLLFTITFPIACWRLRQDKKFAKYDFHLKSLTVEYKPIQPQKK